MTHFNTITIDALAGLMLHLFGGFIMLFVILKVVKWILALPARLFNNINPASNINGNNKEF